MAGHREAHGRPRRSDAHPKRQRDHLIRRLAAEPNPKRRLSIAFDHLRAVLADHPKHASRYGAEAIERLLDIAQRAGKEQA